MRRTSEPTSPVASARRERAQKQALEGEQARAEYSASVDKVEANTARLKALRLEREKNEAAALREALAAKKAAAPAKPKRVRAKVAER